MQKLIGQGLACLLLAGCVATEPQSSSSQATSQGVSSVASEAGASSSAAPQVSSSAASSAPAIGNSRDGAAAYAEQCALCHGENGEGVPQFNSPSLIGCSVCNHPQKLADYIDAAMPPGGPEAAKRCEGNCAEDVAAFIVTEFNSTSTADCGTLDVSPSSFKRLSRLEYAHTLQALLQLPNVPDVSEIPDDPSVHNFKTIASVQNVQPGHLRGYMAVAQAETARLMQDTARRNAVLGCDLNNGSCLSEFIARFGKLAYRRPLTSNELNRLQQFASQYNASASEPFAIALQVLLSSPNFIYRVEVGDNPEGLSQLNDYELASRLAFALWGQGPDSDLLTKAERGELASASGIQTVAKAMLADPRAKRNMTHFIEQWLAINLLNAPVEKPANWYDGIFDDMRAETQQLLADYIWQGQDFRGVFTDNRAFITPDLARYYGLPAPNGDQAVLVPAGSPRADTGLLTHASNMFAKTDGDLIAIRGNWLRSTFLCEELKLPANIADVINGKFAGFTPMEILHARNTDTACERCHAQIDPIGIAFAPFSRAGLFESDVNLDEFPLAPGFPDSNDPTVQTIQDIARELANMPEVGACLADRLFLFTQNREPAKADHCAVAEASNQFASSGHDFTALLLAMVQHPSFATRVAPEPKAGEPEEPVVTNVALGASVATSSNENGNPGSRIVDGSLLGDSRWSAQYFPQQATLDLGASCLLVQAEFYPYMDRAYRYEILVSSDGNNYTQIVNRLNNNDGGNVISDLFAPVNARYVRVRITGVAGNITEWSSLRELRLFGSPVQ